MPQSFRFWRVAGPDPLPHVAKRIETSLVVWPGAVSLYSFTHGEASSGELGADDGRIDVVESVVVHASIGADPVVVGMCWVIEVLVDEDQATTRAKHPVEFGDAGMEVGPVVHRVDGPGGVDASVLDREMLSGAIDDLDPFAGALPEPTHTKDTAHERHRVDRYHMGTYLRREHGAGTHACAYVEDSLVGSEIEQRDHRSIYR